MELLGYINIETVSRLTVGNHTIIISLTNKYIIVLDKRYVIGYRCNIHKELKFFGTREQGQSVLHDGQLTLTKNLNVPRIGPALDADDTPRRDRLVVEYNTSTNPTFEGAVRDTVGRGNGWGLMVDSSYDATKRL